jgi:hypothetical protein
VIVRIASCERPGFTSIFISFYFFLFFFASEKKKWNIEMGVVVEEGGAMCWFLLYVCVCLNVCVVSLVCECVCLSVYIDLI